MDIIEYPQISFVNENTPQFDLWLTQSHSPGGYQV